MNSEVMKPNDVSSWNGIHSPKKGDCPFGVEFIAKPMPSNALNSMEAGRVRLDVYLKGDTNLKVSEVTASITNHYKEYVIRESKEQISKISNTNTTSKASLTRKETIGDGNRHDPINWVGELSIPGTWTEGGSSTIQRDGSHDQFDERKSYSLIISYRLEQGKVCKATFESTDAFHWASK